MQDRSVLLQAVGDIAFGDHPLCAGFGTHSACRRRPPDFVFQHVLPVFSRADVLFGNLECSISERGLRRGDYHSIQMRGHAPYADGLKAAGFDVLNLANNHSQQHGPGPFLDTVDLLRSRDVAVCGLRGGDTITAAPATVVANGLTIQFLGYSLRPRQYFSEDPLYAEGRPDGILADVRTARTRCDVVVVSLHWGDEFIDRPSPQERALAHTIIDAGATLIIGHHPHVLRGVERYGRGQIIYSLGNFVCDMLWEEPLRESAIAECRVGPLGVEEVHLRPIRIGNDYRPAPLEPGADGGLANRIAALSDDLAREVPAPTEGAARRYSVAADAAHRQERRMAHRYFIRNAYRFPPGILVQQLTNWAKNRLAERGLYSPVR